MSAALHTAELNRARDWYNPLRGLDLGRIVHLLEEGERGRYAELQKLNRMAEKRHPTLKALKERRLNALKQLDWDVKLPAELPAGLTAAQAEAQRVYLRAAYERIENLPQAVQFLALATFRGYAHLEKRYERDDAALALTRLNPVPQWHWLRDPATFAWGYDRTARGDATAAVPVDPADWIIREVDDPLCEIALLCFIRRNFAKKDWSAFMGDYAIPSVFATLGENTPLDKVKEWLAFVERVTGNSRGALPPGATVTPLELGKLDGVQFSNFIAAEDADLVLAGTGGMLTMLTANTGLNGGGQGEAHAETFEGIALGEAREVNALFQAQLDRPLLAREFPGQPAAAYFELAAQDEEDATALADRAQKFFAAGLEVDAAEVGEKVGLTLTRKAAPVADPAGSRVGQGLTLPAESALKNRATPGPETPDPRPSAPGSAAAAGREARFLSAAEQQLAAADLAVLAPLIALVQPIRAELARLADLVDDAAFTAGLEALQPALRRFQAALPVLEEAILTGRPELDEAFSDILGTAFRSGLEEASQTRANAADKTPGGLP